MKDRKAWHAAVHGGHRVRHDLVTEKKKKGIQRVAQLNYKKEKCNFTVERKVFTGTSFIKWSSLTYKQWNKLSFGTK